MSRTTTRMHHERARARARGSTLHHHRKLRIRERHGVTENRLWIVLAPSSHQLNMHRLNRAVNAICSKRLLGTRGRLSEGKQGKKAWLSQTRSTETARERSHVKVAQVATSLSPLGSVRRLQLMRSSQQRRRNKQVAVMAPPSSSSRSSSRKRTARARDANRAAPRQPPANEGRPRAPCRSPGPLMCAGTRDRPPPRLAAA
jgi:hypothetical protein